MEILQKILQTSTDNCPFMMSGRRELAPMHGQHAWARDMINGFCAVSGIECHYIPGTLLVYGDFRSEIFRVGSVLGNW